jgi:hypothetical protein
MNLFKHFFVIKPSLCLYKVKFSKQYKYNLVLAIIAAVMFSIHYVFGEYVSYPMTKFWAESVFWEIIPYYLFLPICHWLAWSFIANRRLDFPKTIISASIILCLGDLLWYVFALNWMAFEHPLPTDYWWLWTHWIWVVLAAMNFANYWRCFNKIFKDLIKLVNLRNRNEKPIAWLHLIAYLCTFIAILFTLIHVATPRMKVNKYSNYCARRFIIRKGLEKDFDYLINNLRIKQWTIGVVVSHIDLANLQKRHFYDELETTTFQKFLLSPQIDETPVGEYNWRRTFWESFYPLVHQVHDPIIADEMIVHSLRQRVGIDSSFCYKLGVETIWIQGMTDEIGFQRILVAALRSIGIAARLNLEHKAEFWTGREWASSSPPFKGFR